MDDLQVGDKVSVATLVWGEDWAKAVHAPEGLTAWRHGRTHGVITAADGDRWICDFDEEDGNHASWSRKALRFETRPTKRQKLAHPAAEDEVKMSEAEAVSAAGRGTK
jgi:hypothetical protein